MIVLVVCAVCCCCCLLLFLLAKKQIVSHVTASGLLALYTLNLSCFVRYNCQTNPNPLNLFNIF